MMPALEDQDRKLLYGNFEMLVLAVLAGESMHGYRLRQELMDKSRQGIQVGFGGLYPLLAALQRRGYVNGVPETVGKARFRIIYSLPPRGRARLALLIRKWTRFQADINRLIANSG
ncbi:MAG: PadR family transcriptional regulator [Verrucomicrobia bacterium]|nr:PadR family transcriptional regulator [Verrucomicrobiota bacterium]MCG2680525.1 PadR family transcriptional regulator [Kiritimatiellia bacterium]MBU4248248.1 PadR family transcriptional regulator [Verrucomicrobiota bacterium]MBU4290451.1 PadR family transcriptional regulator [Verrucomicrobiota bacterium]MBU4428585.1 PadR family transcriptional regulator [Verrucomicrobiota bacterium]